ncbi:ABC transporter permease subunit [Petrotoga miotherma]|uniref:ABC transporter permease subunit n=1 Tax=Petrotoga miotherma TaxID=28237 RepID=UPI000CA011A2|nr:ABC transporter permease subunit [Petrotoga miotherma]
MIKSAKIDGASELKIFWRIIIPLSQPVIAALAVLSFTWRWNDYIWPLLVVSSPKYMTLQLGLALFSDEHTVQWGSLLAMTTLSLNFPIPESSLTANKDKGISKKIGLKPLFFGAGLNSL